MNIELIGKSIDGFCGIERIFSTIANELSKENNVEILNQYKKFSKPFYNFDSRIKTKYLMDYTKENEKLVKKKIFGIG